MVSNRNVITPKHQFDSDVDEFKLLLIIPVDKMYLHYHSVLWCPQQIMLVSTFHHNTCNCGLFLFFFFCYFKPYTSLSRSCILLCSSGNIAVVYQQAGVFVWCVSRNMPYMKIPSLLKCVTLWHIDAWEIWSCHRLQQLHSVAWPTSRC